MASSGLSSCVLETLTPIRLVLITTVVFLVAFAYDVFTQPAYPKNLPSVGHGRGLLGWIRNCTSYLTSHQKWTRTGYDQFSKSGQAFLLPGGPSRPSDIVVPRSQTAWLLDQPDHIVSALDAHNEILYNRYNLLGDKFTDEWSTRLIHRNLARHLPRLVEPIADEVHCAVDDAFGTCEDEWRDVNLWDAFLKIIPRVTNRILIGETACRQPNFLQAMIAFADALVINCMLMSLVPQILHPIVGRLLGLRNWFLWKKGSHHVLPAIRQRLDDFAAKRNGDPAYSDWTPPEDFLTWTIRTAYDQNNEFELQPEVISKRLLPIEFASIHTTTLTCHSLFLDLLASDPAEGFIPAIAEEASRTLAEGDGVWTKASLLRLVRADSAIRESMRVSNFASTLVERKIVAPNGLTNPVEGWHLPQGSFVTLNLSGLHHDDSIYPGADRFDALRFSRIREERQAAAAAEGRETPQSDRSYGSDDSDNSYSRAEKGQRRKRHEYKNEKGGSVNDLGSNQLGMVCTGDAHLAFGHGRHACPGRFLVAHEIKMILAHFFLNYDVEQIPSRPQPMWLGRTTIPSVKETIRIRRKAGTGTTCLPKCG